MQTRFVLDLFLMPILSCALLLGFAELQTDLGELVGDLTGTRLPYHNLHSYLLQSLFPGSKDHPTLHPPQVIYYKCFIVKT